MSKKVLLTGGAGFIGHQVLKQILVSTDWDVLTFDRLSYAGNLKRIDEVINESGKNAHKRFKFIYHDLKASVHDELLKKIGDVNYIIHIGASSHVTKSVEDPRLFLEDNVVGTFNLLEASRRLKNLELFYYFSTDEVFGPSSGKQRFLEWDRYNSKNPYSASKAAGEEFAIAYENTYSIPMLISHCSNVYGERQNWEKFIPNTIKKILNDEEITVHTDDSNIPGSRYYIHNEDVAKSAVFLVDNFEKVIKSSYQSQKTSPAKVNITGNSLISNLEVVEKIGSIIGRNFKYKLLSNDPSRPSHDIKYGLDNALIKSLGGEFDRTFDDGLNQTVNWFLKNDEWLS